jgi:hypothetical protein
VNTVKREGRVRFIVVLLLVAAGMVATNVSLPRNGAAAESPPGQPSAPAAAASKEACLDCHGPFDKLVANVNYQAPSGEKITPHRYVPHAAKEAKAIPECSNCHEPHPVPPAAGGVATLPKPDVQWCYTTCHHKNTFQLCKDCHK